MKLNRITAMLFLLVITTNLFSQKRIELNERFNKIIISPHVEAVFVKGNTSSIEVKNITVSEEKFKYELTNNTLQVYLEGAKTYTKTEKGKYENIKTPIYSGTVAKIIITYRDVHIFSIRGTEKIIFEDPIIQEECRLSIYGESEVIMSAVDIHKLNLSMYGKSFLTIESGNIQRQKIIAYGGSKLVANRVVAKEAKITAYGDGSFELNVSDRIKIDSYGGATILYKGNATLKKGIVIGKSIIKKME